MKKYTNKILLALFIALVALNIIVWLIAGIAGA